MVFVDRLGTKAIWAKDPPKEALDRAEKRLEKATERLGTRTSILELYAADVTSTLANTNVVWSSKFELPGLLSKPKPIALRGRYVDVLKPETVIGFSDSIIAWRELGRGDYAAFELLCKDVTDFFCDTLLDGDFYRGVISLGEFVVPPRAVIGPAVTEAGSWYERADWMGIALTPSAEWFVRSEANLAVASGPFVETALPLRQVPGLTPPQNGGKGLALAWPRVLIGGRPALLRVFGTQLVTPEIEPKYRNTLAFFDEVMPSAGPRGVSSSMSKSGAPPADDRSFSQPKISTESGAPRRSRRRGKK